MAGPLSIQLENRTPHGDMQISVARIRRFHWLATEKEHVLVKKAPNDHRLLMPTPVGGDTGLCRSASPPAPYSNRQGTTATRWTEPRLPPDSLDRALIVATGVSSTLEVTSIGIRDVS
ncbi:hypothetical protein EDB80DRAFT_684934 [Ilyonectria destructans]|nr:hypothetical protein EDB80DRAFT_684934 [Ilyonectria destructans]